MSRKHFEFAAEYIRNLRLAAQAARQLGSDGEDAISNGERRADGMEELMIELGQMANPRFDAARFRKAARPE